MVEYSEVVQTPVRIRLTKLFEDCAPTDSLAPYQIRIRDWATTYLAAPHSELGREGSVCPYTATSITKEMFWVGCVDRPDLTARHIESIVTSMIPEFDRLLPTEEPGALLKTILILFPAVTDYGLIDQAQRRMKHKFVARGLMIGQFYPGCEEPGIRNPEFRPLRSPFALLAIRHMVSSDFPFLAAKPQWVEEYLKKFAPSVPVAARSLIAAKFEARKPVIQGRTVTEGEALE